jgi:hypothetical protein
MIERATGLQITTRLHQLDARQPDRVGIVVRATGPGNRETKRAMIKLYQALDIVRPERDMMDVRDHLWGE